MTTAAAEPATAIAAKPRKPRKRKEKGADAPDFGDSMPASPPATSNGSFDVSDLFDDGPPLAPPSTDAESPSPETPEGPSRDAAAVAPQDAPIGVDGDAGSEPAASVEGEGGDAETSPGQPAKKSPAPPRLRTPLDESLAALRSASNDCWRLLMAVEGAKAELKEAKAGYDLAVKRFLNLGRAIEVDGDRPLLNGLKDDTQDADESDDDGSMLGRDIDEIAPPLANEILTPALAPGQIRIRLLKKITDEHPERGTLTYEKGIVTVAVVDSSGQVHVPFDDEDLTDGTGLLAEEFEIVEERGQPSQRQSQPADESWKDTPLAETSVPASILKKLTAADILTVGDLAAFTEKCELIEIEGVGAVAAGKVEDAMAKFWEGRR